ncbi:PREDICTED: transcriptional adapter ADA2a isoform X1 [Populus euphratica]|uniref:Transcriptional adapter n=1 Tax=Populus euphratica TaxID=75702 RepID=A0AAJ6TGR0_POPEU|nr:PREDICTED: transcriptional adapter ADA2a isoform X1 [Populus euphratica]
MGRSRGRPPSSGTSSAAAASDDPNNSRSSKRKKTTSNVGSIETAFPAVYQETSQGKLALYHCNYCYKDISGMVRIKCAVCPDFDLCLGCFSVGAEVTPHKSNHPYRVMDNLSFPLFHPDWNTDEEILLLEGIEMYGFGNWTEVSEHVGTKSKSQCIDHYNAVYMDSPCFPLPDMSHVMGKTREELLAMARGNVEMKKELSAFEELTLNQESPFSVKIKSEALKKEDLASHSSSIVNAEVSSHMGSSSGNTFSDAVKKASNEAQIKDKIKVEEPLSDRSIREKKPRICGEEGPSMTELSGYNFKRQEFEIEYDNDAEQLLADMEFKDTDTHAELDMKLQVLRIYSKRLDERKRRKDFILERNLFYPDAFEKNLSPEEKEIYQRYKVFMRFHTKEEHEELMKTVIEDRQIMKRIQDLQEARAAGCRTAGEAQGFIEQKRKKEAEENAQRAKESMQAGPAGKLLPKPNHLDSSPHGAVKCSTIFHPGGNDSSPMIAKQAISSTLDEWDIAGFQGADLLSESDKRLCCELRILPAHYLNMLHIMSIEITKGTVANKTDAHSLFKVESSKVDRVYDMLVKKGIAQA